MANGVMASAGWQKENQWQLNILLNQYEE